MALLNDVLDQTKEEAVATATSLAAKAVGGPDVLTTPELLARLEQYQQATQAIIDTQASQISELLAQGQTLAQQLAGKASADSLSTLRQRVTNAEASLDTKAATTFVSQQVQAVATVNTDQTAALSAFQQMLATDDGILQGLLAKVASHDLLLPALRLDVDAKAAAATVSSLTGQVTTLRNTVNDAATGLAATNALAANALPVSGGTLTGALNVLAPTTSANPLQFNTLPFSMTFSQTLPLVALGGLYTFNVTVQNAQIGQVVVLNMPATLLNLGTAYAAVVSAANTVTITLKAGAAIAAGAQTFYLRVLR